ncbi:MAG TPA: hypothetical protein VGR07_13325 [Thermoanaerobaculia bacterium]|jgi:hypothetical protein|nr:hypothetical protein [Thermoanaerobaculia bacterium]
MTTLTYDIRWSPAPAAAGGQALLGLLYEDRESGYRQSQAVTLDEARPGYRWTLDVPNGATGAASYSGVLLSAGGGAVPLPSQPLTPVTAVGSSPRGAADIAVGVRIFTALTIDFDTVAKIAVSYRYAEEPRAFTLDRKQLFRVLVAGVDYTPGEPLVYDLRYDVAEGSYLRSGLFTSAVLNAVPDPFSPCQAGFRSVGLTGSGATVRSIQLQYQNVEDGPGWTIESPPYRATLDADRPDLAWTFVAVDPTLARVRYSGTVVMLSGKQVPIPLTETTIKEIPVGDTPGVQSVEVTADVVHWDLYATVLAALWTVGAGGQKEHLGEQVFEPGTPPWYWSYVGPRTDYTWQAVYYPRAGGSIATPERTGYALVLTLPSEV